MSIFERIADIFVGSKDQDQRDYFSKVGLLEGWISIVINLILAIIKFIIGFLTGSVSVMGDAVHTLSDFFSSGVVLWGFYLSRKPPDKEHPYGHGRSEPIATLILAILLAFAGLEFLKSSIERIVKPAPLEFEWWMIITITITIAIKEVIARFAIFLSKKIDARSLEADAWHHRLDAISSILVVVAMIGGKFGYYSIDGWGGLGVSLLILWSGYDIARDAVDELLGSPPEPEIVEKIRQTAMEVPGVLGVHDIALYRYGQEYFASLHIEVDKENSLMEAHSIAEEVEMKLKSVLGGNPPTVHLDPIDPDNPKVQKVARFLSETWGKDPRVSGFHDIRIVEHKYNRLILLGATVNPELNQKDRESLRKEIMESLTREFPEFQVKLKLSLFHHL